MNVSLENLTKKFDNVAVVDDVTLEIGDAELFFLLGPSGCGKTTLLRILAGFYQPDHGIVRFGNQVMNDVAPNHRNTGMVFQNYALWPHMTVYENIAYGLDVRKPSAREKKERVHEALALVRMTEFAERSPSQLSGGQQQRVALARALVIRPNVLLLDEPLSNLDARLRLEMREEIRRIHRETRLTAVYVTHDQAEALSLGDRIAVMREGRVEQVGTPRELYQAPRNRFVAGFVGEANFMKAVVADVSDAARTTVTTSCGVVVCASKTGAFAKGQSVTCVIRPESLQCERAVNRFDAQIRDVSYLGSVEQYALELADGMRWKAVIHNASSVPKRGERVSVFVKPEDVILLED